MERYSEALHLYEKTLLIELQTLPDDAKTIAVDSYHGLSKAYLGLKRLDEAILAGEQAVNQLLKTLPQFHPEVIQYNFYLYNIKQRKGT